MRTKGLVKLFCYKIWNYYKNMLYLETVLYFNQSRCYLTNVTVIVLGCIVRRKPLVSHYFWRIFVEFTTCKYNVKRIVTLKNSITLCLTTYGYGVWLHVRFTNSIDD